MRQGKFRKLCYKSGPLWYGFIYHEAPMWTHKQTNRNRL